MSETRADVLVIGAGAAGIFAAWRAASLGARTILLEKTPRIGTKILVSGGGKCNIVHDGPLEQVLSAFRPSETLFLRPSVYRHPNETVVRMFTERGLEVYTRPDGRIFPVHATAKDVVTILRGYLDEVGVDVRLESPCTDLIVKGGAVRGANIGVYASQGKEPKLSGGFGAKALLREAGGIVHEGERASGSILAAATVLATGGSSYPNSGTTGDGWKWAQAAGHTIVKPRAALAPIYIELEPRTGVASTEYAGVALREIELKARANRKTIASWEGDLLFTHQGISGPVALGVSREVTEAMETDEVTLWVDLAPEATAEEISDAWRDARGSVEAELKAIAPERIVWELVDAAAIPPGTFMNRLDQRSRNRLADLCKAVPIGRVRTVPLEKGEVVAGGVALDEVDPKSMKSSKVEGLFLCGEVLDVAGPVGGYNLQAAFATGFVAGESAVNLAKSGATR